MVNCGKGRQERWPGGLFSFLEISKVLRENLIHPQSLTWNLKIGPGKGDSYWKPSFSGSMFNFRGVPSVRSYIKTQYWIRGAFNSTVLLYTLLKMGWVYPTIWITGWWFQEIVLFSSLFGEDDLILTSIFCNWVETTNYSFWGKNGM